MVAQQQKNVELRLNIYIAVDIHESTTSEICRTASHFIQKKNYPHAFSI